MNLATQRPASFKTVQQIKAGQLSPKAFEGKLWSSEELQEWYQSGRLAALHPKKVIQNGKVGYVSVTPSFPHKQAEMAWDKGFTAGTYEAMELHERNS